MLRCRLLRSHWWTSSDCCRSLRSHWGASSGWLLMLLCHWGVSSDGCWLLMLLWCHWGASSGWLCHWGVSSDGCWLLTLRSHWGESSDWCSLDLRHWSRLIDNWTRSCGVVLVKMDHCYWLLGSWWRIGNLEIIESPPVVLSVDMGVPVVLIAAVLVTNLAVEIHC